MKGAIDKEEQHHCLLLDKILEEVNNEIWCMSNEIFNCIYEDKIRDSFIWVIKHIGSSDNERYGLTYFVNDDTDEEYEINHYIEFYSCAVMSTLGKNNIVTQKILRLLTDNEYWYFYSNGCTLHQLENALDIPDENYT